MVSEIKLALMDDDEAEIFIEILNRLTNIEKRLKKLEKETKGD